MFEFRFLLLINRTTCFHGDNGIASPGRIKTNPGVFGLIELMVVIAIIVLLSALIAPAFRSSKAPEMSRAPLTPSKACSNRRARTRWLTIPIHGSVFMKRTCRSLQQILQRPESGDWSYRSSQRKMASKVSTQMRSRVPRIASILRGLVQLGKLIKIKNVHLPLFAIPIGTPGNTLDTRPPVQNDPVVGYNDSRFGELNASPQIPRR